MIDFFLAYLYENANSLLNSRLDKKKGKKYLYDNKVPYYYHQLFDSNYCYYEVKVASKKG